MSQQSSLDVNVDMGESFGRWTLGDDAAIMPFISSANVACGYHAGDPPNIRRTVSHAVEQGVQIGAHVSLPDLLGFGRRAMAVSPSDLRDYCVYQIGALAAFVAAEGGALGHVKPHGAMYPMCTNDPELAGAVAAAMAAIDPNLMLFLLREDVADAVSEHGIRLVREAFLDLDYDAEGELMLEAVKRARDPEQVAERALRLVREHKIEKADGSDLDVEARTVCIHGDGPNAVDIAKGLKRRLEQEGIEIAPLAAAGAR